MMSVLRDYRTMVVRPQLSWIKKHWKGYTIFLIIVFIASFVYEWYDVGHQIGDFVQHKFGRKNKNEEES